MTNIIKVVAVYFIFSILPFLADAQSRTARMRAGGDVSDLIYIDKINGWDAFYSDTLKKLVDEGLKKHKVDRNKLIPLIYFTNNTKTQYLKMFGGSDAGFYSGYGWYFCIGYTEKGSCATCGTNLGKMNVDEFIISHNISLGDSIGSVGEKLFYGRFRHLEHLGVEYVYYEKYPGDYDPEPYLIYFFKFKNEKLIEIGFGRGMEGVNPMFYNGY